MISLVLLLSPFAVTEETTQQFQDFSSDPGWIGKGNRTAISASRTVVQDFGYSRTNYAGGATLGEIGGRISRSLTPATYAKIIPTKTLNDRLTASGKFSVIQADGGSGMLFGWFNNLSQGWRTPNSMVIRLDGNSGKYWMFFEYGTQNYRTGGGATFEGKRYQTTKTLPMPADGRVHTWSFTYEPDGAEGNGEMILVMDGKEYTAPLQPGHKDDGAIFNRFGMFNQQVSGKGMNVYFTDLSIGGMKQNFSKEPDWEGKGNRITFEDREIRPYHNFGFSPTNHAGGEPGEIGGLIWRIQERHPEQAGYYAAPIGRLSMAHRLKASGKVAMVRAAADSAVLLGWFNSPTYIGAPPKNFIGILIEGPSRIGHYFRPIYSNSHGEDDGSKQGPIIKPSAKSHEWTLDYEPDANNKQGRITVTLDNEKVSLNLKPGVSARKADFDMFGIVSYQRGGHYVDIYFDEISYTVRF